MAAKEALGEKEAEVKGNCYWNKEIKEDVDDQKSKVSQLIKCKKLIDKIEYKV